MDSLEPKKLALIRIWQILKEYSDYKHPLTQEEIAKHLEKDYGIVIERKAIGRNISLLKEAGFEIESSRAGSFLDSRDFEDAELHMLIDGVLSSRYITAKHSKALIDKLCSQSSRYFRSHVKNIYSVNDWSKTDNQSLFYNIEMIDLAIEKGLQLEYEYNKYGLDKKLHKSSTQVVSPYQMILHNQRYYLMAYSEYWGNMVFHRIDRITKMRLTDKNAFPLRQVPGYEKGIDYRELSTTKPYMFSDKPERVELIAESGIVDQIIDWFGRDINIYSDPNDPSKVRVILMVSPNAMENWALQYLKFVEVVSPDSMREKLKTVLSEGLDKYK